MDNATPPGAEHPTMGTSDRVLQSIAQQFASTATPLLPTANLMSLATETIFFIVDYLDEGDLAALCLVNHRLNNIATPILWKSLSDNPERQKEVLLWAAETGQHALLQNLLDQQVSPNFLYLSPILKSRLKDVLAAQGLRGAVRPREDRVFEAEVFREKYCRSGLIRNKVRHQRGIAHLDLAMTDNDLEWNLAHADYPHTCSLRVFGLDRILGGTEDRQYWAWAPIHVAVLQGDNTALRMLLDHGADVNAQCSGLCDCAAPDLSGKSEVNSSVAPHHDRSVWTPLHVAMCTGNLDAARLLIARGASALVGSLIRQSYGVDRKSRLSMNAFQNVAWMGSVPMCQILLATPRFGQYLNRLNLKSQTALHYAAAGGNIRTVGKLLLQNGATYDDYGGGGLRTRDDPLRLLCKHGKYEDARWLIHFCLDPYQGRGLDPRRLYTRVLAAVCDLRPHTAYNRLSLRAQQDQLYSMTAQDIANLGKVNWQEVERSGLNRVTLAITLLSFGADVNRTQEVVDPQDHRRYRTPLQIAASSQFHQMVEVLLGHGADHNKIGINPFPFAPNQQQDVADLPLMLAIASALSGPRKGKLAATQILARGTSLADIGPQQQSVLAKLQALLWNGEGGYCDFLARDAVWAYFAQLLLHYGAAAATSQRNWEAIVASACVPTNLEYCRLLEQWRPIAGFSEGTLVEMMRGALFGCGDWAEQRTPEDVELVKWVLGHCRKSGGFVAGPLRDAVLGLAETALRGRREVTGTAVVVGM